MAIRDLCLKAQNVTIFKRGLADFIEGFEIDRAEIL
jgi:hypothetical protein